MRKKGRVILWLRSSDAIQMEDMELYRYAIQKLIISIIPMAMAIVFGMILKCGIRSVCIVIPFMLIRKYSGGYHAPYLWLCTIESGISMFGAILITKYIENNYVLVICVAIASLSLIIFSPIDSENRRLSEDEKRLYKRTAAKIAIVFFLIYMGLALIGWEEVAVSFAIGIILAAGMQLPCIPELIRMKKLQYSK